MKYEIVAFYKQEIEEIRECAENIGRLYGWRYRCEKIPGSGKLLSACMGEDSVLCLLKRKSYSFYRLMKYVYALNKPVLVLQDHFSADTFQQLKIPVGYLKENKEIKKGEILVEFCTFKIFFVHHTLFFSPSPLLTSNQMAVIAILFQ